MLSQLGLLLSSDTFNQPFVFSWSAPSAPSAPIRFSRGGKKSLRWDVSSRTLAPLIAAHASGVSPNHNPQQSSVCLLLRVCERAKRPELHHTCEAGASLAKIHRRPRRPLRAAPSRSDTAKPKDLPHPLYPSSCPSHLISCQLCSLIRSPNPDPARGPLRAHARNYSMGLPGR